MGQTLILTQYRPAELGMAPDLCPDRQTGGRMEGLRVLSSFLQTRGQAYHKEMSSLNSAFDSCSRLSPYVAYGALSMREVVQATRTRVSEVRQKSRSGSGTWRAALSAFSARLHWHCHFIQKLRMTPASSIPMSTGASTTYATKKRPMRSD